MYLSNVRALLDDFGMYKVSEEYGAACAEGTKLQDLTVQPTGFQVSLDYAGEKIGYEGFDWDALGTNLVPDPTVSHFEDGVYGKYATPDENFEPANVNPYYWWDKYIEKEYGFVKVSSDLNCFPLAFKQIKDWFYFFKIINGVL